MIVGIDLGTTNSLISYFGGADGAPSKAQLIPNALGEILTPSCVSLTDDGSLLVGRAAREHLVTRASHSAAAFKRAMGTDREFVLGNKRFRAEELSALVLRSLLADAKAHFGELPTEAVISVPAYFNDAQRKATRAAGQLAGIKVERLINEPTAAALAYGLETAASDKTFLIFDLGGGTFDVSILEMFEGVMQVHASAGDNFLGGEDFTRVLIDSALAEHALRWEALTPGERGQLVSRFERGKLALGRNQQVKVVFEVAGKSAEFSFDEARFEELAKPLVQRLRVPIERALRDAKMDPAKLSEVVLVGGSARLAMVPRLISRMFGRLALRHLNPDEVIGLGAGVAAGLKARDAALEEVVLTDVSPYTMGLETSKADERGNIHSGFFAPIIERNSTVPVSRSETFGPVRDHQKELELVIYQGESPHVSHNVRLGMISIALEARKALENQVEVRFTYDVNGLLQVEATELRTKRRHELIIQQNPGLLSEQDIRSRLAQLDKLKMHPREAQENTMVIARAERIFAEYLLARPQITEWLALFAAALGSQDLARIEQARREFNAALDHVEQFA